MLVVILQRKTLSEREAHYFLSISAIPSGDPFFCASGRVMVKKKKKKMRKKKAEKSLITSKSFIRKVAQLLPFVKLIMCRLLIY